MNEPDYYIEVRKRKRKQAADWMIEQAILRAWTREWSEVPDSCPYLHTDTYRFHPKLEPVQVTGWAQHMLRYQKLVLPQIEINPWIIRMWQSVDDLIFRHKRKIGNFIGSKNSGKTNFFAVFAHLMISIDPDFSRCFISGPYKTAADATIWGRMETRFNNMKQAMPKTWSHVKYVKERFTYSQASGESGYIELITLDKVGKLQGTKSLDPSRGHLILICDEIAEFPSAALLDALDNLTGNDNFLCLTGCNFKNIEGLDGDLCRPEGREYAELNIETDHDWPSNYKSWTFRFDGHSSPNILAGEVVSRNLLKESNRQDMEDIHGLLGPKYLEQIRSFPNSSMSDFFVTTREKIKAGGSHDSFQWHGPTPSICAFCDPGFGGDPCKIGAFRFGPARVQTVDGTWAPVNVFEPLAPIETIQVNSMMVADEAWLRRVAAVASGDSIIKHGAAVTTEQQIVVQCAEFLSRHDIPRSSFGYDGSMRASIVHEMVAMLGPNVHSIDFGGQATDRPIDSSGTPAREAYYNFVTEMYFAFATIVQAGQFRGADKIPAAIAQIVRRPWSVTGKKKQIQPKRDYKAFNQGRSPDDADTLAGGLEMARRLGFGAIANRRASDPFVDTTALIATLAELPVFARPSAKKLVA